MARLGDVSKVMRTVGPWSFAKQVWGQIDEDNIFVWAAALAYSWLFAIFPFFIFLLTLVPLLPAAQKGKVIDGINNSLHQSLPEETANLMESNINRILGTVMNNPQGALMSVGLIVALWAASGGMAMTMSALDRCYDIDINRPFYKQRPFAMVLTIGVATLLLLILVLLPVGTIVLNWLWKYTGLPEALRFVFDFARWLLALLMMMMLLNVVYHFGPQVKQHFRFLTPGAVFSILVWIALGLVFRYYVNRFAAGSYDKTYGTVGGVVILLFLFYIDALVLLIGAEINSEIDFAVLGVPNGTLDLRVKTSPAVADPSMPSP